MFFRPRSSLSLPPPAPLDIFAERPGELLERHAGPVPALEEVALERADHQVGVGVDRGPPADRPPVEAVDRRRQVRPVPVEPELKRRECGGVTNGPTELIVNRRQPVWSWFRQAPCSK